ncbi:hypothetical protein ABPG74_015686 [Tetrahymena malaccensis]
MQQYRNILKIINKNYSMIPDLKQTLAKIMRHSIQEKDNNLKPQEIETEFKLLSDKIISASMAIFTNINLQYH